MKTWRSASYLVVLAGLVVGCGETEPEVEEIDHAAAIPDGEMLRLSLSGDGSQQSQGLEGGPAGFKQIGEDVAEGLNELIGGTQDTLREIAMNVTPVDIRQGATACKLWEFDHEDVHWQLFSCERDLRKKEFAYVLRGRPAGSTSDEDYLNVFAGYGKVLPRHDGRRRGAGVIGYDWDSFASLTGAEVTGKLLAGYRAAGRARQVVIGMENVQLEAGEGPYTALFRYAHVIGLGGRFVFWTPADVLALDEEENLTQGQDGTAELVRAAIAWNREGAARTAYTACGGTVSSVNLTCVTAVQCWTRNGAEVHADVSTEGEPTWSEARCPRVPFEAAAPDQDDVEFQDDGLEPGPIEGE